MSVLHDPRPPDRPADRPQLHEPALLGDLLVRAARDETRHVRYCLNTDLAGSRVQAYGELLREARLLLAALRAHEGCAAASSGGGRVAAMLLERPDDLLPLLWAGLIGGIPVCPLPLPGADQQRWSGQLRHVRRLLDDPLLITTPGLAADPELRDFTTVSIEDLRAAPDVSDREGAGGLDPSDLALLILTSGSTGTPKAVELSHANVLSAVRGQTRVMRCTGDDVFLNWIAFDHVAALVMHLLAVSVSACQVQLTPQAVMTDPVALLRAMDHHRASVTFAPNFLLGLINEALRQAPLEADLSCVRCVASGGEATAVGTGTAFLDLFAPHGLDRGTVWPTFGMTETSGGCLFNHAFPGADAGAEFAAVGAPGPGVQVRVADGSGRPLPDGETGELQIRGPVVFSGYHRDPDATRAAFTGDGWLRTGDLAEQDRGWVTLAGRGKDSIIVNGVNYFSQDLENRLNELDDVEAGHVAAFPTRPPGADTEHLVIALSGTCRDSRARRRLLIAVRHAAVTHWGFAPSSVLLLDKDAFPRTGLGKIQRSLLRQRFEAGAYAAEQAATERLLGHGREPVRGRQEQALAEIFARTLNLAPEAVGATTSFFDLGGTSLELLRLQRHLGAHAGVDVPLSAVLAGPTVRDLATHLDGCTGARAHVDGRGYQPLVTLQAGGSGTPLLCVHPLGGDVLAFVNLARHFADERPVHALRARGLNPGEQPFSSLEEMTGAYAEAIVRRQPRGPYAIAGLSLGGLVAFELAKRLEAAGERVAFLGIIDMPPFPGRFLPDRDWAETAVFVLTVLDLLTPAQAEDLPARLRPLTRDARLELLVRSSAPRRLAELDLDAERLGAWVAVAHAMSGFVPSHRLGGAVSSMTVLHTRRPPGVSAEHWLQAIHEWDDFSHHPNRYAEVPGDHYTMLGPRHVAAFQEILRCELAQALGEP
ncbi:non-ribosomal peptide synthetase [Nonomuraea sp. NN258]|uniref:non-ribosomal peptide synthetase n=1 Tax=Nonomuraea antri TaxID=2730852 RepID=UPI00156A628B|nr:non-ribosomal peptide synthetase [Nonomuraea antri]NRQ31760.1 non-ribosomal peptide synthetase [Nonomuraea antri]